MNAFTAVVKAAEDEVALPVLVHRFLIGENAKNGDIQSINGTLYEKTNVLARRTKNGTVLLARNSLANTEINDALVGSIFANGVAFQRLDNFSTILDSSLRVNELRNGKYTDFATMAALVGFEYSQADIDAIERSKAFTKTVTDFFTKLEKEEKERLKSAVEKERAARVEAQAIEWDKGNTRSSNSEITGAGGKGYRLRTRLSTVENLRASDGWLTIENVIETM
jgi:hypothetical protein